MNKRSGLSGIGGKRPRGARGSGSSSGGNSAIAVVIPDSASATVFVAGGNAFAAPGGSTIALSGGGAATLADGTVLRNGSGSGITITLGGSSFVLRDTGSLLPPRGGIITIPGPFGPMAMTTGIPLPTGTTVLVVRPPPPALDGVLRHAASLPRPWALPAGGTLIPDGITLPPGAGGIVIIGEGGWVAPPGGVTLGGSFMVPSPGMQFAGARKAAGTILPGGTRIPGGTIIPEDAVLPGGTIFPGGTKFPGGTLLPVGTVLPVGTRFRAGVYLPGKQVAEKEMEKEDKEEEEEDEEEVKKEDEDEEKLKKEKDIKPEPE